MNFGKKYFSHTALIASAISLSGCAFFGTKPETEPVKEIPVVKTENPIVPEIPAAPKIQFSEPAQLQSEAVSAELKILNEQTEKLVLEKRLIESRMALAASENEKATATLTLEKMQLDAMRADRAAKLSQELATIDEERTELERRLALETARGNAELRKKQLRAEQLDLEMRELNAEMNTESLKTNAAVAVADRRAQLANLAPAAANSPKYLKEPFVDGTLYISDRRVEMNGPVTDALARSVCEQIYFYSNQNADYPIFLVIDNSPGGSVAAGYQIQKAMRGSRAPVYVVVKGFAASMAAVITTTAERSFCFENTHILHHQLSTGIQGNLTVLRESVSEGEQWYERIMKPVADKMGISLEEFTKQMYAHNSDGDWAEDGKRAAELKWVDHVVSRIEETGIISVSEKKMPAQQNMTIVIVPEEKIDAQGRRFVELPALSNPFDFWAIYDKENYYRAR